MCERSTSPYDVPVLSCDDILGTAAPYSSTQAEDG